MIDALLVTGIASACAAAVALFKAARHGVLFERSRAQSPEARP